MTSQAPAWNVQFHDVFAYIDQHQTEYIDRLLDYVRRPSISAHGTGIAEVAEHIARVMSRIGLETQIIATAGWPVVFGQRLVDAGKPTVLLYGHYDVQPPDPLEEWLSPPFEPEIRDGRVFGRGVADNKGQHLAQILAVEAWLNTRGELPCNVKVLLEGEEEVGSPQMPAFIRENRGLLACDLVVTSDGPIDETGLPRLTFGVRGVLSFELRARGANQDLHSGHWGGAAPNPVWALVHLLATMKNDQGVITIDGFYDDVLPFGELERQAIARLPLDLDRIRRHLELNELDAPADRDFWERTMAWPTLTINGFHGGYGGPGSKTVLPHQAFVKCDIRLVERQTADDVFQKVERHVRRHAPQVTIVRHGAMDPSRTPLDSRFAEPLRQAVVAAQHVEPLRIPSKGGSLPDYVFTKLLGVPAFGLPYANADEANHAPNENLEVDRFVKGIRTGAAMLGYLGRMKAGAADSAPR